MRVKITFLKKVNEVEIPEGSSIREAIKKAGINPEEVIINRNGTIIPDSEKMKEGELIETIRITSGG
jgi:sulfur carrier protein ThiS